MGMVLCTRFVSAFTNNFNFWFSLCIFNLLMVNLLRQVCFDFARIVATVMTAEILPVENIVRSIACILRQDVTELSDIRYYYVGTQCFQLLKLLHLFKERLVGSKNCYAELYFSPVFFGCFCICFWLWVYILFLFIVMLL